MVIEFLDLGETAPGRQQIFLELDGIFEFECRPFIVVRGKKLHAVLVIALRAIRRRAAAGNLKSEHEKQGKAYLERRLIDQVEHDEPRTGGPEAWRRRT